jgi:hypothetical protein
MNTVMDFMFNKKLLFPEFINKYRSLKKDIAPRHQNLRKQNEARPVTFYSDCTVQI